MTLDNCEFLLLEGLFLPDEIADILSSFLDHDQEVFDAMFCDGPFLGVILQGQHFCRDCLFQDFDVFHTGPGFLEPAAVHLF